MLVLRRPLGAKPNRSRGDTLMEIEVSPKYFAIDVVTVHKLCRLLQIVEQRSASSVSTHSADCWHLVQQLNKSSDVWVAFGVRVAALC